MKKNRENLKKKKNRGKLRKKIQKNKKNALWIIVVSHNDFGVRKQWFPYTI